MKIIVGLGTDDEIIVFTDTKYYIFGNDILNCYHETNKGIEVKDWLNEDGKRYYKFHIEIEVDEQLNLLSQIKEQLPEVFL